MARQMPSLFSTKALSQKSKYEMSVKIDEILKIIQKEAQFKFTTNNNNNYNKTPFNRHNVLRESIGITPALTIT